MSYSFDFDLTEVSRSFFRKVADVSEKRDLHHKVGNVARKLVKDFKVERATGMNFSEALHLMEDMVDINVKNLTKREEFEETEERALLLPHCARKHMDDGCD
ncbi:MAG: hypothetical protein ABEJ72_01970, partial [Candidatus Aenigmatarchaeota archaeon]